MYCEYERKLKQWEKDPLRYKAEIQRLDEELYQEFLRRKNSPSIYTRFEIGTPEFEKAFQGELDFHKLWNRIIRMCTAIVQKESLPKGEHKALIIPING